VDRVKRPGGKPPKKKWGRIGYGCIYEIHLIEILSTGILSNKKKKTRNAKTAGGKGDTARKMGQSRGETKWIGKGGLSKSAGIYRYVFFESFAPGWPKL